MAVAPGRTPRPAAQAPSQAAGLALVAARTSAHTPAGEGPAPRPPPPTRPLGWGEERSGAGSGKGRAPLAAEPHLSNVENPNTSFKHLGNIQPRCATRMRLGPLPRRRPRPPPHSRPSPSRAWGLRARGRPARGRGLACHFCQGRGSRKGQRQGCWGGDSGRGANFTRSFWHLEAEPLGRRSTPAGKRRGATCFAENLTRTQRAAGQQPPRPWHATTTRTHSSVPDCLRPRPPQRGISTARKKTGNHSSQSTCQPHFDSPITMKRRRGDRE